MKSEGQSGSMAKSKFEYVRNFEQLDSALRNTYMVVRLDGKGFHRFSQAHDFMKPNDKQVMAGKVLNPYLFTNKSQDYLNI